MGSPFPLLRRIIQLAWCFDSGRKRNWTLGETAFARICATVPNPVLLEWGHYFNQNVSRLAGVPHYAAGFLELPEARGIGVELNDAVVKELLLPGF